VLSAILKITATSSSQMRVTSTQTATPTGVRSTTSQFGELVPSAVMLPASSKVGSLTEPMKKPYARP
jgi:hypothetical protein